MGGAAVCRLAYGRAPGKVATSLSKAGSLSKVCSRDPRLCSQIELDFRTPLAHPGGMTDTRAILAANTAFYVAFSTGNLDAISRLWADSDNISCIHPGWPVIVGRAAVIGSWRDILQSPSRPQITCHEPYPIVAGDWGHVVCIELVEAAPLAASNHFRLIDGVWRLVHHQSSPIAPSMVQRSGDDQPGPAGRVH
jgi:SnoaL-like domain